MEDRKPYGEKRREDYTEAELKEFGAKPVFTGTKIGQTPGPQTGPVAVSGADGIVRTTPSDQARFEEDVRKFGQTAPVTIVRTPSEQAKFEEEAIRARDKRTPKERERQVSRTAELAKAEQARKEKDAQVQSDRLKRAELEQQERDKAAERRQ